MKLNLPTVSLVKAAASNKAWTAAIITPGAASFAEDLALISFHGIKSIGIDMPDEIYQAVYRVVHGLIVALMVYLIPNSSAPPSEPLADPKPEPRPVIDLDPSLEVKDGAKG